MPRIWLDYLEFLMSQPCLTKTRRTFDRALRALPVTQHSRIWEVYTKFAEKAGGETTIRVLRRYIKVSDTMDSRVALLTFYIGSWNHLTLKHLLNT